jgi:hypothetical protein
VTDDTLSPLSNVITIDDERIKSHLDRIVRGSVEETLNAWLDAEADRLYIAQRYGRSEARRDMRAGYYERGRAKHTEHRSTEGSADERCRHRMSQGRVPLAELERAKNSGQYSPPLPA